MSSEVETLYQYVLETVGPDPGVWPGGWPDEIESALIDTIFSIRARYGSRSRGTGVYGAVARWRAHRGGIADDLGVLAATPEAELRAITNGGKVAGRTKAQAVIEAAGKLAAVGVRHARQFDDSEQAAMAAYLSVKGCGPVTWAYFRMLLGHDDVKADTWVIRFVGDALPHVRGATETSLLVQAVAELMNVDQRELDHAIWRYRRLHGGRDSAGPVPV